MANATANPTGTPPPLTEVLPNRRVAFPRQIELIRGYGALGASGEPVENQAVARVVGLKPETASLANAFFLASGLIRRDDRGVTTPAPEVVSFQRDYEWTPDTAAHALAPLLERAWFGKALAPFLAMGPITEAKAIAVLGSASNATQHRSAELRVILDYLEVSGVIERRDGQIRKGSPASTAPAKEDAPIEPPPAAPVLPVQESPYDKLPLLIRGLLEQLPEGTTWTPQGVKDWLAMAELAFRVVYDLEAAAPVPAQAQLPGPNGSGSSTAALQTSPQSISQGGGGGPREPEEEMVAPG
jgi:hypothetical protein